MRNSILTISILLVFGCFSPEKNDQPSSAIISKDTIAIGSVKSLTTSDTSILENEKPNEKKNKNALVGKVFEVGLQNLFLECSFNFACDCCASDLLFLGDSISYFISYCSGDTELIPGKYTVYEDTVKVITLGITASEKYNWSAEVNSTVEPYYLSDTVVNSKTYLWTVEECNSKILMKEDRPSNPFIALEKNQSLDSLMSDMARRGITKRLENRIKTGANNMQ